MGCGRNYCPTSPPASLILAGSHLSRGCHSQPRARSLWFLSVCLPSFLVFLLVCVPTPPIPKLVCLLLPPTAHCPPGKTNSCLVRPLHVVAHCRNSVTCTSLWMLTSVSCGAGRFKALSLILQRRCDQSSITEEALDSELLLLGQIHAAIK